MKPRLPAASYTIDDAAIWLGIAWARGQAVRALYREADRRDAEVMYRLGRIRDRFKVAAVMMLGTDKPTAPGLLAAGCRHDRDPGRAFELDYRP